MLLNGGVFRSERLAGRLVEVVSGWWPGRGDIPVLRSGSLDLAVARGSMGDSSRAVIPASDAVGQIVAIGRDVRHLAVGDRVCSVFFPNWASGPVSTDAVAVSLGGALDGVLAEEVSLPASAVTAVPDALEDAAAAIVPCAGVTAWHALFEEAPSRAGDAVLLLGTGGVSLFALQLAVDAGLRVAITSSDDEKLAQARALGAEWTVNYRWEPNWGDAIAAATGGVHKVLEVGGAGTLVQSLRALRPGGSAVMIGGVSGDFGVTIPPFAPAMNQRIAGILVGSRAMTDAVLTRMATRGLRPVIGAQFGFDEAPLAFRALETAQVFGKVVIALRS